MTHAIDMLDRVEIVQRAGAATEVAVGDGISREVNAKRSHTPISGQSVECHGEVVSEGVGGRNDVTGVPAPCELVSGSNRAATPPRQPVDKRARANAVQDVGAGPPRAHPLVEEKPPLLHVCCE